MIWGNLSMNLRKLTIRKERDDLGDDKGKNPSRDFCDVSVSNTLSLAASRLESHHSQRIAAQADHPSTVCSLLCLEPSNSLKNMNLAETEAYKTPRKMIVGIMKENETFL